MKELTDNRKKELDRMSEEDVYYFWNIFSEKERSYINSTSAKEIIWKTLHTNYTNQKSQNHGTM